MFVRTFFNFTNKIVWDCLTFSITYKILDGEKINLGLDSGCNLKVEFWKSHWGLVLIFWCRHQSWNQLPRLIFASEIIFLKIIFLHQAKNKRYFLKYILHLSTKHKKISKKSTYFSKKYIYFLKEYFPYKKHYPSYQTRPNWWWFQPNTPNFKNCILIRQKFDNYEITTHDTWIQIIQTF